MSQIYVVRRVYSSCEIPLKAYRVEAQARGEVTALKQEHPDRHYDVRTLELVED